MRISPRLLFSIAGAAFLAIVLWPGSNRGAVAEARARVGHDRIVLFSAAWCGYCNRLRSELKRANVQFAEHDVESSTAANAAWRALGGRGVPLTLIGEEIVHGYDPGRVLRLAAGTDR